LEGFKIEIQTSRENSRSKNWYLLKKGHHTGPFTFRELHTQYERNEITGPDMVWKQGLSNWIRISELNEFDPTPPPIPVAQKKEVAEVVEEEEKTPEPAFTKKSPLKYSLLLIPFLVIGFIYYYLTIPPKRYLPFARLNNAEFTRLNTLIAKPGFKGELILSKDGKELWLATGSVGHFRVDIVLDSIDGKILGSRKVRLTSTTTLKQNWARFHAFDLEYGTKIVPGNYTYNLIARPLGPKQKLDKFLKKNKVGGFNLKGEILFTNDTPEKFAKNLVLFKKKERALILAPYNERLEKWNAYLSVITKVDILYQDTLKDIKYGKSIKLFENKYNEFLGSMLRSLILEMREVYKNNLKSTDQYKRLYLFGRQIGEMVSDMMVKTKKYKVLGAAPKGRLSRYFLKKTKGFKEKAEKEIGLLQDKIKSFEQS